MIDFVERDDLQYKGFLPYTKKQKNLLNAALCGLDVLIKNRDGLESFNKHDAVNLILAAFDAGIMSAPK